MYKKLCTRCYHSSFSSCHTGEWICPTCSKDLTDMKAIVASSHAEVPSYRNYQKQDEYTHTSNSVISYKI